MLLWALPDPARTLRVWADLLPPDGRLVLIEGYWYTRRRAALPVRPGGAPLTLTDITVENLSARPELWGRAVTDERYVILANRKYRG